MSKLVSALLLILIAMAAATAVYVWVVSSVGESLPGSPSPGSLKVEAFKVTPEGAIVAYVRNVGASAVKVDAIFLVQGSRATLVKKGNETIKPGEVKMVVIDSLSLRRVAVSRGGRCYIKLSSVSGAETTITIPSHVLAGALSAKVPLIGLQAIVSSSHWIVLDYSSGHYRLYGDYGPGVSGRALVAEGYAPILAGVDEYTITSTPASWGQRPVDSPVLIVVNPTKAGQDWVFTWHDPHGTFRFYLEAVPGEVELDFLIFWEDLYYPPTKRTLDDWKDHVIRVTVFLNGTYRIAVYLAKGGYSHKFYLGVEEPFESVPDQASKVVYTKPHGATWRNVVGGYYRAMPDKIFITRAGP